MTLYLLDTNVISDLIINNRRAVRRAAEHLVAGDDLGLCRPVHFEILRGLLWRSATGKLQTYRQRIVPLLTWVEMAEFDWEQAAQLWADSRRRGKQLGDPDLLLAALVGRERAILVSSDADFDRLPVTREDWRI